MTTDDLIAFWSRLGMGTVHPDDDAALLSRSGLETGLLPLPWNGPIKSARVFVALLNPGLDDRDVPYEQTNFSFRQRLRRNLEGHSSYVYFDRANSDHPGNAWAYATFGRDLPESFADELCVVQLVAYHAQDSKAAYRVEDKLRSSALMKVWLRRTLLARVRSNEVLLVVGRGAAKFGVEGEAETPNFICYKGSECRRAHMTQNTRGGSAIRRFLNV